MTAQTGRCQLYKHEGMKQLVLVLRLNSGLLDRYLTLPTGRGSYNSVVTGWGWGWNRTSETQKSSSFVGEIIRQMEEAFSRRLARCLNIDYLKMCLKIIPGENNCYDGEMWWYLSWFLISWQAGQDKRLNTRAQLPAAPGMTNKHQRSPGWSLHQPPGSCAEN